MPIRLNLEQPAAPRRGGIRLNLDGPTAAAPPDDQEGFDTTTALATGGALLAGGMVARNPRIIGRAGRKLLELRQQLMLSGLAVPKAILGNIGGAAVESVERGTINPLRQLLSPRTLRDVVREYRAGAPGHIQAAGSSTGRAMHGPGRLLGAIDEASQAAFARAGLTPTEAKRVTFQTPLNVHYGQLGDVLDSPAARYLIPFRRTPFNVFYEGLQTLTPTALRGSRARQALLAGAGTAGVAHGAETAEEQFPVTLGLGAAAANRYALPYLLAASLGRSLAGGRDPSAPAAEALPISEFGLTSGLTQPLATFTDPAGARALRRLLGIQ